MQNSIRNLTEFIKKNSVVLEQMTKEIEKLKEKWLNPLEQLIEKINLNFSSYFFAMDCAGEVTLSHGENVVSINTAIMRNKILSFLITFVLNNNVFSAGF